MAIAITLEDNNGLNSKVSSIFGRCPFFLLIDPETKEFTIHENEAKKASGGAGVQAAQWVVDQKVDAVITGNVGPKAHTVLFAASLPVYQFDGTNIDNALEAYAQQKLTNLFEPNTDAHAGIK